MGNLLLSDVSDELICEMVETSGEKTMRERLEEATGKKFIPCVEDDRVQEEVEKRYAEIKEEILNVIS